MLLEILLNKINKPEKEGKDIFILSFCRKEIA